MFRCGKQISKNGKINKSKPQFIYFSNLKKKIAVLKKAFTKMRNFATQKKHWDTIVIIYMQSYYSFLKSSDISY
jgi:hypothetical protein